MSIERYTRVAIFLHWLIALAVIGQIALGWYLGEVPRGVPARTTWVNLHKSIGLVIGLLALARLAWRLTHRPPALPASLQTLERRLAPIAHGLLYACLIGMPLAGYIASNHSRFGVRFFGLLLPPWGADDPVIYRFFTGVHGVLARVFVVLIVLHVIAALKHALIDRDTVLERMLPAWAMRRRTARPPN
jgi:cytochrome b561